MYFLVVPEETSTLVTQLSPYTLRPFEKTGAAEQLEICWLQTQLLYSQQCYLTRSRQHFRAVRNYTRAKGHYELLLHGCSVGVLTLSRHTVPLQHGDYLWFLLLFPPNAVMLDFFVGSCSV